MKGVRTKKFSTGGWFAFFYIIGLFYFSRLPALQLIYTSTVTPIFMISFILYKGFTIRSMPKEFYRYLLLTAIAAASFVMAISLADWMRFMRLMLGIILMWVFYCLVLRNNNQNVLLILWSFVISSLLLITDTVLNIGTSLDRLLSGRFEGVYDNPNALAFTYLIGVFAIFLIKASEYRVKYKFVLNISLFLFIIGILSTASRKTALALLVFFGFYLALNFKKYFGSFFGMLTLILLLFFIQYSYNYILEQTYLGTRFSEEETERGVDVRENLLSDGFNMFLAHPILGVGLGNFQSNSKSGLYAHNDFMEVLGTLGLLGIITYFILFIILLKRIFFLIKYGNNIAYSYYSRTGIAILISYISIGMGRPHFIDLFSMTFFIIFIALFVILEKTLRLELTSKSETTIIL